MSGLSDRLKREPDYRPHCLNCETMERMTLEPCGSVMWCKPVRDTTFDNAARMLGLPLPTRFGCDFRFDIETGLPPSLSNDRQSVGGEADV